jgi:hypothetical protein
VRVLVGLPLRLAIALVQGVLAVIESICNTIAGVCYDLQCELGQARIASDKKWRRQERKERDRLKLQETVTRDIERLDRGF